MLCNFEIERKCYNNARKNYLCFNFVVCVLEHLIKFPFTPLLKKNTFVISNKLGVRKI